MKGRVEAEKQEKVINSKSTEIKVENLDHLGIVAGIIDEIGIVEYINEKIGRSNDPEWIRVCIRTVVYV